MPHAAMSANMLSLPALLCNYAINTSAACVLANTPPHTHTHTHTHILYTLRIYIQINMKYLSIV